MQRALPQKATAQPARRWLRLLTALTLLLLAVQFLIGVVVNLYVQVPDHPGTNAPDYFGGVVQGVAWALAHGAWSLQLHAVIGILLFLASLLLIGYAIAARRRAWIVIAVIGWSGITGAGFNGASFLNYGENFSSLLMSVGFFLAMTSYVIGLFLVG